VEKVELLLMAAACRLPVLPLVRLFQFKILLLDDRSAAACILLLDLNRTEAAEGEQKTIAYKNVESIALLHHPKIILLSKNI